LFVPVNTVMVLRITYLKPTILIKITNQFGLSSVLTCTVMYSCDFLCVSEFWFCTLITKK